MKVKVTFGVDVEGRRWWKRFDKCSQVQLSLSKVSVTRWKFTEVSLSDSFAVQYKYGGALQKYSKMHSDGCLGDDFGTFRYKL